VSSSFVSSDLGFFGGLAKDWRKRLEEVEPFQAGIPEEGLDIEGAADVAQKYENLKNAPYKGFGPAFEELREAYYPYRDRVAAELASRGFPDIQSGLDRFSSETGVEPLTGKGTPQFSYEDSLHELLSHQRPYDLGMAPDYRDFFAGYDPEGNPVLIKSNTITPINEDLATELDVRKNRLIRGKDISSINPENVLRGGNVGLLSSYLNNRSRLDDASRRLLGARLELQYPFGNRTITEDIGPSDIEVIEDLKKADQLLDEKYTLPMGQRLRGLVFTQFPGVQTQTMGLGNVDEFLQLVGESTNPESASKYFYGTFAPGVTPDTLTRIAGDIRRTPSSLLPGAADLIPSPEAVRAGFQQGPVEMGQQMAKDFAAGLPAAAIAAPILASPAVAPFAPGIGVGLVGKAATKALNEAIRQQTGEGIVPKIRQAIGTKPRTGVASPKPQRSSAEYTPAQITKATPQAVANLEKQRTQSELQRKGEFGLTEMLFGR
jgi:hypothetical protein